MLRILMFVFLVNLLLSGSIMGDEAWRWHEYKTSISSYMVERPLGYEVQLVSPQERRTNSNGIAIIGGALYS